MHVHAVGLRKGFGHGLFPRKVCLCLYVCVCVCARVLFSEKARHQRKSFRKIQGEIVWGEGELCANYALTMRSHMHSRMLRMHTHTHMHGCVLRTNFCTLGMCTLSHTQTQHSQHTRTHAGPLTRINSRMLLKGQRKRYWRGSSKLIRR